MAQWRRKPDFEDPPEELLNFDPNHWVLGGSSNPERVRLALERWYEARWQWVTERPGRTIDGLDVIDLIYER